MPRIINEAQSIKRFAVTTTRCRSTGIWQVIICLRVGAFLIALLPLGASGDQSQLAAVAGEARQVIAVVDWFYVRHRACPQPWRPGELAALESELGDGFSAARRGWYVEIRGISMTGAWLYYTSVQYPERCTLWRQIGQDVTLIWRRHNGGRWTFDLGDGGAERPLKLRPQSAHMGDK